MQAACAAHDTRQQAMDADFMSTLNSVAADMGCDTTCTSGCMRRHAGNRCYSRCHCGRGAIHITNTPVNTMAIVKEQYGDLNQMNEDELVEFSELANNARIQVANRD